MKLMMKQDTHPGGYLRPPKMGSLSRFGFGKSGTAFAGKSPKTEGRVAGNVGQILDRWGNFSYRISNSINSNYSQACGLIENLTFFGTDVRDFCQSIVALSTRKDPGSKLIFSRKLGLFLSALINNNPNRSCIIDVRALDESTMPSYLGYANTKNLTVLGNVSSDLGTFMVEGSIRVRGNAHSSVGTFMRSGTIIIEGNARGPIGEEMRNAAVIHVNGMIAGVRWPIAGQIFHKGRKVTQSVPPKSSFEC